MKPIVQEERENFEAREKRRVASIEKRCRKTELEIIEGRQTQLFGHGK